MRVVLFCFLYIFWLFLCAVIALPGFLFFTKKKELNENLVKKQLTICRCLFEKGLISESLYAFETDHVAKKYDLYVFKGYRLIVAPVIYILKRFSFIDSLVMYFVDKWVHVHKYQLESRHEGPPMSHILAVKFCITVSRAVGKSLKLFNL